jgi:hypothetical protein
LHLFLKAVGRSLDVSATRSPSYATADITPTIDQHVGNKPDATNIGKNILNVRMVFNASFNNISAIWWWSVLLMEETGVPGEIHRPIASH